jgi:hypothetical protein
MAEITPPPDPPIIDFLRTELQRAQTLLGKPEVPVGQLFMFSSRVRFRLEKIYGEGSPLLSEFPPRGSNYRVADPRAELTKRADQVRCLIKALKAVPEVAKSPLLGKRIFIGHGRSLVWLQLKDFLRERLNLPCDEFNLEPAAGIATTARLDAMLAQAGFAFVVMTAEEKHADGRIYARPNVIHESGLFQGRLGTRRAIVLLEDGCSDFTNIAGLTQLRFPKDDLRSALDEVRRVLEREGII